MNARLSALAVGIGIAVVAAGVFLIRAPSRELPATPSASEEAPAPASAGDTVPEMPSSAIVRPETLEADSVEAMRQRVADLELALQGAIDMRGEAEAALEASEREVEALEAYVEEIEARGDDPADFADEAMQLFQPAFFRFEDASAAYERAELLEQAAREELAKARAALAVREAEGAGP